MNIQNLLSPALPKDEPGRQAEQAAPRHSKEHRTSSYKQQELHAHLGDNSQANIHQNHHLREHPPQHRSVSDTHSTFDHRPDQAVATHSLQHRHQQLPAWPQAGSPAIAPMSHADGRHGQPVETSHTTARPVIERHESGTSDTVFKSSPHASRLNLSSLRTLSNRSLATLTMDDVPADTPTPRAFDSNDLPEEELSTVNQLLSHLNENSYAYDAHVQLVGLLHKGFVAHAASPDSDAGSYSMLPELRQAREAMDSRFAVGEALWLEWLTDETQVATSSEDRVEIVGLMQRATQDEPASNKLWQMYIDWVEINYATCHAVEDLPHLPMDDEDKEVCRAIFTADMLYETLEQAAKALRWRVDSSHAIWNKYLTLLRQQVLSTSPRDSLTTTPTIRELENLFLTRLQDPQADSDGTMQIFWPLASKIYGDQWETQMSNISQSMELAHAQMELREVHEHTLRQAIDSDDQAVILEEFNRYLRWEKTHKQRAPFDKDVRAALFERALLHFPTHVDLWVEYVDFVISRQPSSHNPSSSVLPLLERATKHCPWSGELWARRILRSDYERRTYAEIEAMKHRATSSGLLDIGGMEDYLKVLVEWCSYLRRQAFSATADDDNKDTAEVGITMALEDMQEAGRKIYGNEFKGDPLYRLELIQIKFLSQARRIQDGRDVWRSLVPSKKSSAEFWLRYYTWEITLWIIDRIGDDPRIETTETGPQLATAVVEEALSQRDLDWPEKVADMYMDHFQHHECVEKVQAATIGVREFRRRIAHKRAKEVETMAQQEEQVVAQPAVEATGEKRKREEENDTPDDSIKRTKMDEKQGESGPKRDRENLIVTLSNLPADTTAKDVRSFLRGCGDILSIEIAPSTSQPTSATVEFEQKEDKEFAKTRTGKLLNGNEIQVHSGTHSTLYVTNYPPAYDEADFHKLFSSYGNITAVRFPSLKFNSRRRFCYVQFAAHEQAKAAEAAMDGKKLDGRHELVAKISDPNAKKQRGGAQAEQREVFVKNIDNNASEAEVSVFFEQYGKVESINLLKNVANKRLGSGFVVFASKEEAQKAIEEANGQPLKDRILHVSLSSPKGGAAPTEHAAKQDIIVKHTNGHTPSSRRGSDVSMHSAPANDAGSHKTIRERQVALFNVPHTVTDARIVAEMEKHGRIVKVQLRREQDAAIVEFEDVKTAFEVRVGIDLPALGPECKSGEVNVLFNKGGKSQSTKAMAFMQRLNAVSRPVQRGGRRGGLGFKRGGSVSTGGTGDASKAPARSNADFKAMFEQGKPAADQE